MTLAGARFRLCGPATRQLTPLNCGLGSMRADDRSAIAVVRCIDGPELAQDPGDMMGGAEGDDFPHAPRKGETRNACKGACRSSPGQDAPGMARTPGAPQESVASPDDHRDARSARWAMVRAFQGHVAGAPCMAPRPYRAVAGVLDQGHPSPAVRRQRSPGASAVPSRGRGLA